MKGEIVNKQRLGEILGMSAQRIHALMQDGMPIVTKGNRQGDRYTFDTAEVIEWFLERERRKHTKPAGKAKSLTDEKRRHTAAAAHLRELELADKRSTIITRQDAAAVFNRMRDRVVERIQRIPQVAKRCANKTAPQIESTIKIEIHQALTELSQGET